MFAESSEEIEGSCCGASDAEAVSLGLKMMAGVVGNLKRLKLASVCGFDALVFFFQLGCGWGWLTCGLQAGNRIGEAGVLSLAEGLRVNSSLQMLDLVSAFNFGVIGDAIDCFV